MYKQFGYEPHFVTIDWRYKTINDWVEQVKSKISKRELENSLLSGFSWGAMTSLVLASEYINPKRLLLFSLSPYFAEDIPSLKTWWLKRTGKRRTENFRRLSMVSLSVKIKCPTTIFVGSKEGKELNYRVNEAHKRIKNSKLILMNGVKHDVANPKYIEAIKKELVRKVRN